MNWWPAQRVTAVWCLCLLEKGESVALTLSSAKLVVWWQGQVEGRWCIGRVLIGVSLVR